MTKTIELKTFEELALYEHLTDKQRDEAKQEAIKHIEDLEKSRRCELKRWQEQLTTVRYVIVKDRINFGFDSSTGWIKHFFNITEEELK